MIGLGRKGKTADAGSLLQAFVQSWEMRGADETSICSGALDLIRAYLNDRPCCVWKKTDAALAKICERGMIDIFYRQDEQNHQAALTRAVVSGASEFDPCPVTSLENDLRQGFDGFLHVPVKNQEDILGLLSIAVLKKEARDRGFVQPLECMGRLLAISLRNASEQDLSVSREKQLKAEVESATRELESTNKRLIERVKELKLLYNELHKRVQELTQANRAKDEFLSVVSHELRTPLTSINGFLAVLLEEEAGTINDQQRKFLTIAKASSNRLNLIISDLLDISRIESGRLNLNLGVCSTFTVLKNSIDGLMASAKAKKISLVLRASSDIPNIWGDADRLQQVVDNLISNAIKFTEGGGSIEVVSEEKGDFIQISVKDTGQGLTPEEQAKVFDMFYQADTSSRRPAGGVGLGLAIARGIVMMHGGQLNVQSEKGKGSTFFFMLPRHKAQRAA